MDFWRLLMYVVLVVPLAALAEMVWRRQWGALTDRLLNVGVYTGLFLMLYLSPVLRGAELPLFGTTLALLTVLAVRWYGPWHRRPGAKPKPPAA